MTSYLNHHTIGPMRKAGRRPREMGVAKILVPTNFLPHSASALRYARMFGRRFGANITLLHVVEPIVRAADYGYGTVTTCCPNPHLEKNAETRLRGLAKRASPAGSRWGILVRTGIAESEIPKAAREIDADLIVMGASENHYPSQAAIGSTAVQVVGQAPCPVLVVPQKTLCVSGAKKGRKQYERKQFD